MDTVQYKVINGFLFTPEDNGLFDEDDNDYSFTIEYGTILTGLPGLIDDPLSATGKSYRVFIETEEELICSKLLKQL